MKPYLNLTKKQTERIKRKSETFFIFLTITSLVAYPMLLPLLSVKASDSAIEQTSQDSSSSKETKTDDSSDSSDSTSTKNDASEKDQPAKDQPVTKDTSQEITKKDDSSTEVDTPSKQIPTEKEEAIDTGTGQEKKLCTCKSPQNDSTEPSNECCKETSIENTNVVDSTSTVATSADTGNNTTEATATQDSSNSPQKQSPDSKDQNEKASEPSKNETSQETSPESALEQPTNNENVLTNPNNGLVFSVDNQPISSISSVTTGSSSADSTIINEANTNIVANNYAEVSTNITGNETSDINLLEQFQALLQKGLSADDMKKFLEVYNTNTASITNSADAQANTGNNTDQNQIITGDASATANIINVINRNIVGNSWLFAIINVLGTWSGNLILPGQDLLNIKEDSGNYDVTNINNASITNNATTDAQTGNNLIDGSNNSAITTGDAQSTVNVETLANTNITKNNWFFLMINNMGTWTGKILGWDEATQTTKEIFSFDFATLPNSPDQNNQDSSTIKVTNDNNADISNTVNAQANTGNNSVIANAKNAVATIETGAATAKANIFNLINTNITGNNWMFAIVNVIGNWTGNAIFAYPDLAISIDSKSDSLSSGDSSTFIITYANIGKAASEDAVIDVSLPKGLLSFSNGSSGTTKQLDGLQPGQQKTIEVTATADEIGSTEATSKVVATVSTKTTEKETANNSTEEPVTIKNDIQEDISSKLKIKRNDPTVTFSSEGEIITHSIIVENSGESLLYDVVLRDSVVDPSGNSVSKYEWSIGDLRKGKKVSVKYQILIDKNAKSGTYTNKAKGYALDIEDKKISSNISSNESYVYAQLALSNDHVSADDGSSLIPVASADTGEDQTGNGQILGENDLTRHDNYDWGWIILLLLFTYAVAYGHKIRQEASKERKPIRKLSARKT